MQTPSIHPLKQYREKYQLSQAKVARQLGVTQGAVKHWEQGSREISVEHALTVEEAYHIPAEILSKTLRRFVEIKARRPKSQDNHEHGKSLTPTKKPPIRSRGRLTTTAL